MINDSSNHHSNPSIFSSHFLNIDPNRFTPYVFSLQEIEHILNELDVFFSNPVVAPQKKLTHACFWLTFALHWSRKNRNSTPAKQVEQLIYKLMHKHPESLINQLGKPINYPPFLGNTMVFAWCMELNLAIFSNENTPILLSLHNVLHELLLTYNSSFVDLFAKEMTTQDLLGESGLLLLSRVVLYSSKQIQSQNYTFILASLLINCLKTNLSSPEQTITRKINSGEFQGKSILYFVISILNETMYNDPQTSELLCHFLCDINQSEYSSLFIEEMKRNMALGPYAGLNALQMILSRMHTALFPKNKSVITALTHLLNDLYGHHQVEMIDTFSTLVAHSTCKNSSGIMMWMQQLSYAMENGVDITPLLQFFIELNLSPTEQLITAWTVVPDHLAKKSPVSALEILIDLSHRTTGKIHEMCITLLSNIAFNGKFLELLFSLPEPKRLLFLEGFKDSLPLSLKQKTTLISMSIDELNSLGDSGDCKDILSMIFNADMSQENITSQPGFCQKGPFNSI